MDRLDCCAIIIAATVHGLLWDLCRVCISVWFSERTRYDIHTHTECDPGQLRPNWQSNTSVHFRKQIQQVDPKALPPSLFFYLILWSEPSSISKTVSLSIANMKNCCGCIKMQTGVVIIGSIGLVRAYFFGLIFIFAPVCLCVCLWILLFN